MVPCLNDDIRNHELVQPFAGVMIHDHSSLRLIYFSIVIILASVSLISNLLSLITFMRDRIRFTVCGVYLNIYALCGTIVMILFLSNMILIITRYDDYFFRLWSCYGYSYIFSVMMNTVVLMSSAIVIEMILNRYFIVDRFRSRKCALFTTCILIGLVLIFNLEKIFTRYLLTDRSGHLYCIHQRHTSPGWFYMNNFTTYFCPILSCMIHFICFLFILVKIKQQNQKCPRNIFRHPELLLPSSIILFSQCLFVVFRYLLNTCMTYSDKFSIRLHFGLIFILSIPSILTFAIYVLPNPFYRKEFQRSWISRMFYCCCLNKQDSIEELEVVYKLWQQCSSPESVMTISNLNDNFIDTEHYNKIKLEV